MTMARMKLKIKGLDLADWHVAVVDVDKLVTNVTVKDAPIILDDAAIDAALASHGDVVSGNMQYGMM